MKTTTVPATLVLLAAAFTVLPGGAAEVQPPDPCGPTALCQGPECPATDVSTSDLLAYLGPHASLSLSQGCQASVEERGLHCAIGSAEVERTVGPLTVGADVCLPDLDCTCDPMETQPASAAIPGDCELREATPDRAGPLLIPVNPRTIAWGSDPSDCTVDVEPAYECVGGWGEDRHVVVGPVDVTIRRCGQPLPDIQ